MSLYSHYSWRDHPIPIIINSLNLSFVAIFLKMVTMLRPHYLIRNFPQRVGIEGIRYEHFKRISIFHML